MKDRPISMAHFNFDNVSIQKKFENWIEIEDEEEAQQMIVNNALPKIELSRDFGFGIFLWGSAQQEQWLPIGFERNASNKRRSVGYATWDGAICNANFLQT